MGGMTSTKEAGPMPVTLVPRQRALAALAPNETIKYLDSP